jgi:hypothetical protein
VTRECSDTLADISQWLNRVGRIDLRRQERSFGGGALVTDAECDGGDEHDEPIVVGLEPEVSLKEWIRRGTHPGRGVG